MGWFWGASEERKKPDLTSDDPLRNLDPGLRDFLVKESPVKYSSSNPPAQQQAPYTTVPQPEQHSQPSNQSTESGADAAPKVPTLFKDGRYANLWATYHPQAEVEAAGKSDAEKIDDIIEGYKRRKAEIGRAALENCALEQWDVNECFRSGSWASRMTMCRVENRKFERCYMVQAKFLKALGYLSTYERPPEVDERIQMHADTLYHRMLDQEAAVEAAKAEGKSIPNSPPPVASSANKGWQAADETSTPTAEPLKQEDLPPAMQKQLKKRLHGLSEKEREVEEQAIKAEIQAGEEVAKGLGNIWEKQAEEKSKRKEQGRETMGDKLSSMFGFR